MGASSVRGSGLWFLIIARTFHFVGQLPSIDLWSVVSQLAHQKGPWRQFPPPEHMESEHGWVFVSCSLPHTPQALGFLHSSVGWPSL
jgi:hypothetical protein